MVGKENLEKWVNEAAKRAEAREKFIENLTLIIKSKQPFAQWATSRIINSAMFISVAIGILLFFELPRNLQPGDPAFYSALFAGMLTLATFAPPVILTLTNREDLRINGGKYVWVGITKLIAFILLLSWSADISIIFAQIMNGSKKTNHDITRYAIPLVACLSFLSIAFTSVLIAILLNRMQIRKMGNLLFQDIEKKLKNGNKSEVKVLIDEFTNIMFLDASMGRRQNVTERLIILTNISKISRSDSFDAVEQIFSSLGWLGLKYLSDRSLAVEVSRFICFIGNMKSCDDWAESRIQLACHELLAIFEKVASNSDSKQVLVEIVELVDRLTIDDTAERRKFIRQYMRISKNHPERTAWVQKDIVKWLRNNPDFLNAEPGEILSYFETYKWENLVEDTRSRNINGLQKCLEDFQAMKLNYSLSPNCHLQVLNRLENVIRKIVT